MNIICTDARLVEQKPEGTGVFLADFLLGDMIALKTIVVAVDGPRGLASVTLPQAPGEGGNFADAFGFASIYARTAFAALCAQALFIFVSNRTVVLQANECLVGPWQRQEPLQRRADWNRPNACRQHDNQHSGDGCSIVQ